MFSRFHFRQIVGNVLPHREEPGKRGGPINWVLSALVGVVFAYLLAAMCAFVAIELLPDLFKEMSDQTKSVLKILVALFVLWGGRCAYLIVRK